MRRIRITGLVRQAEEFRRAMSGPLSPARRRELASRLEHSVQEVEKILRHHHLSARHLPAPSRRAYYFLKEVDLNRVSESHEDDNGEKSAVQPTNTVGLRGLRSFLDCVLDDISLTMRSGKFNRNATLKVISGTADRLNNMMTKQALAADQLKPQTRQMVAWFRYFSETEHADKLIAAVRRGLSVFGSLPMDRLGWRMPMAVHFRPTSYLYAWRIVKGTTRITLATPMVAFGEQDLERLGRQIMGSRKHRPELAEAMQRDSYQRVVTELETLAGACRSEKGMAYDLGAVFGRVNQAYFKGRMSRPRLMWGSRMNGHKFGHYDFETDTVCLSSILDRPAVPAYVVDGVMHHELLHKKHGFQWQGNRRYVHTAAFKAEEKTFQHYREVEAYLNKLSRQAG